jgi:hypothetical protein
MVILPERSGLCGLCGLTVRNDASISDAHDTELGTVVTDSTQEAGATYLGAFLNMDDNLPGAAHVVGIDRKTLSIRCKPTQSAML